MPIATIQWHIEIGIFKFYHEKVFCFFRFGCRFVFTLVISFPCRNIELYPGPKNRNSNNNFSICHWNLNRTSSHNFAKVNPLEAYIPIHDFDIIFFLSESCLNSSLFFDNNNLSINDYKLVRADHPGDVKKVLCAHILRNLYL